MLITTKSNVLSFHDFSDLLGDPFFSQLGVSGGGPKLVIFAPNCSDVLAIFVQGRWYIPKKKILYGCGRKPWHLHSNVKFSG
jgi:hypothetical protein